MGGGIRIGRLFGIQLVLDYSWFLIFLLVTLTLSFVQFPAILRGLSFATYLTMGIVTSILFFASVLIHELMHSVVAVRYGMHIEDIRLMLFDGVSELTDEPHSPGAEFTMAIVGPLSSIFLGGIFYALFYSRNFLPIGPMITIPALWLGMINILVGVFNLLPGFPLDGGRVFRSIVWKITGDL
ncbi:MAG: site-2 protease family protein, partial [Rubrobacteridae bacterium]|nr:site-2 protease family protein [Rubrobacteridae bacterium]